MKEDKGMQQGRIKEERKEDRRKRKHKGQLTIIIEMPFACTKSKYRKNRSSGSEQKNKTKTKKIKNHDNQFRRLLELSLLLEYLLSRDDPTHAASLIPPRNSMVHWRSLRGARVVSSIDDMSTVRHV